MVTSRNKKKNHPKKPAAVLTPINDIKVPRKLQRTMNKGLLQRIDTNWDESLVGTIDVSPRDGKFIITDGQHRHTVARTKGLSHMWCNVEPVMTDEEIASLILSKNTDRARINAGDSYKLSHTSAEPSTIECQKIVQACGFKTIVNGHSNGVHIHAVTQIMALAKNETLEEVLLIIASAWPDEPTGPQAGILKGLSAFLLDSNYEEVGDEERLIRKLSGKLPDQLVATGKVRAEADRCSQPRGTARAIMSLYNSGRGRGQPMRGAKKIKMKGMEIG